MQRIDTLTMILIFSNRCANVEQRCWIHWRVLAVPRLHRRRTNTSTWCHCPASNESSTSMKHRVSHKYNHSSVTTIPTDIHSWAVMFSSLIIYDMFISRFLQSAKMCLPWWLRSLRRRRSCTHFFSTKNRPNTNSWHNSVVTSLTTCVGPTL